MCILRDPKTLGKVPVSVCLFRGVLHPPSGKWPCNGLFWGSALWKGKSLESISHCSHKSRHSPVLLCLTSQPKLCIGTQGLTSIQIKVSFEKKRMEMVLLFWPFSYQEIQTLFDLYCLFHNSLMNFYIFYYETWDGGWRVLKSMMWQP